MAAFWESVSPQEGLTRGFERLWNSETGADMKVICNGVTMHCHSAIVCSRSAFFEKAVWGGFKEARTKEINLSTESLPIVRRMLKYFYVLDYEGPQADEEAKNEMGLGSKNMQNADVNDEVKGDGNDSGLHRGLANLKLDIQMYSMGDRYHIDCLRDLAASKFEMTCEHLGFSNCYDPATTFEAFIGAAATVYETTQTTRNGDWKLTPPLLNVIAWRIKSDYHFASNQYLRETCLQNAEFAYDLMRSVSSGAHASGNGTSYTWW